MTVCIIGIDCATDAKNVGLARAYVDNHGLLIDQVIKPVGKQAVSEIVTHWIDSKDKTLLAIDAPLGWPKSLGEQLVNHAAGDAMSIPPNTLFRRDTDQFIKQQVGKLPLDVGADRIARTAHAALKVMHDVAGATGHAIPLAWQVNLVNTVSAIEVYPAATLKVLGLRHVGYKKKENIKERREICDALSEHVRFQTDISLMIDDDDVLDAAIAALAGFHFVSNQCMSPHNDELARKEGWIWVKQ